MTELLELLTDPAHLAFEVITDLAFAAFGVLFMGPLVRRHDHIHHPVSARGTTLDDYLQERGYSEWGVDDV